MDALASMIAKVGGESLGAAAPNVIFLALLLLVSVACAAAAVGAAWFVDRKLQARASGSSGRESLKDRKRAKSRVVFSVVGFGFASAVWLAMVGVVDVPALFGATGTTGTAWLAAALFFGLAALARGVLKGKQEARRPQTTLVEPMPERKVA
jgi:hypothetical protein